LKRPHDRDARIVHQDVDFLPARQAHGFLDQLRRAVNGRQVRLDRSTLVGGCSAGRADTFEDFFGVGLLRRPWIVDDDEPASTDQDFSVVLTLSLPAF
jgi:hypothetical protein